MVAATLVVTAALLVVLAPRALAHWSGLRRSPRAALVLWQSISLSAVVCLLAAAPVALSGLAPWRSDGVQGAVALVSLVLTAGVLCQLVLSAHVVGSRLRAARREQRTLVDLVGEHHPAGVRVIPHPSLRAYCVPGLRRRVVITERTLGALTAEETDAVVAHERAHLRARHDLVLEFFAVLHRAAPRPLRAPQALHEVRLLVEVLADRSARRECGAVAVGRALVALAAATSPPGSLGVGSLDQPSGRVGAAGSLTPPSTTATRVRLLVDSAPAWQAWAVYGLAVLVLALPVLAILAGTLG